MKIKITQMYPQHKQPAFGLSPLAYLMDWMGNRLLDGYYRGRVRHLLPKKEA